MLDILQRLSDWNIRPIPDTPIKVLSKIVEDADAILEEVEARDPFMGVSSEDFSGTG